MLRMGIIGMGKMGEFHAGWMTPENQIQLVALCEKNESRAADLRARYGVPVYQDTEQFMRLPDLDFVVVVTTNECHEELAVMALEHGKGVIVEKPMSVTYASAQRMVVAAERSNKHLFVHQSSRWDRDFLLLKDVIASGLLGDILQIQSKVMLCDEGWPSWGIDGMANPWRVKAAFGGGMLLDWGPHLVDQVMLLMDTDPLGVYGVLQSGVWSREVDDYFFGILKFENGAVCQIEASNNARLAAPRWYVTGSRGTFEVKGKSEPIWDDAEIVYQKPDGKKEIQKLKMVGVCESGIEGGFYADLVPYLNGEKKRLVSMYEASKVIKILEMIKRSHEECRFVAFDE